MCLSVSFLKAEYGLIRVFHLGQCLLDGETDHRVMVVNAPSARF